jgi:hypothetical protein
MVGNDDLEETGISDLLLEDFDRLLELSFLSDKRPFDPRSGNCFSSGRVEEGDLE